MKKYLNYLPQKLELFTKIFFGLLLFYYLYDKKITNFEFDPKFSFQVILGLFFYLLAQFVKASRLYYISSSSPARFFNFFSLYLKSNSLAILLPFRLGDFIRVPLLKKYFTSFFQSVLILIFERFVDLLIIIVLLAISLAFTKQIYINIILKTSFSLLIIIMVVILMFEPLIKEMQAFLLSNHNKKYYFYLLKSTGTIAKAYFELKNISKRKIVKFTALSFLAWTIEIFAILLLVFNDTPNFSITLLILPLLLFLMLTLPSGPVNYGGIQLSIYWYHQISNDNLALNYIWSQITLMYLFGILLGLVIYFYEAYEKTI
jgi:hypothetical protein